MKNAIDANIDPQKFWDYTPYEVELLIDKYVESEKNTYKNLIRLAWFTEAFHREKKLPKIDKILKDKIDKKEPASEAEMLAELKRMNAMLGGNTY